MKGRPLTLAEHICLGLVVEGAGHGWAIGTMLAPDGEIGRIWSLSRPLTYRAIDNLVARRLLTRRAEGAERGRERTLLAATAAGRRANAAWLDEPVEHLREVRTDLLVKLALRRRAGLDVEPLLVTQQDRFAETIRHLTATSPDDDLVALWRAESARAVRRFIDRALVARPGTPATSRPELRLSARNQLRATVSSLTYGEVMATVKVVLPDGQRLTAAITREAAEDLDLAADDEVVVIVKATEAIIGKAP